MILLGWSRVLLVSFALPLILIAVLVLVWDSWDNGDCYGLLWTAGTAETAWTALAI